MRRDEHQTVFDRFRDAARTWPERPFLNVLPETAGAYGIESGVWRYDEALQAVEALASAYRAARVGPGIRVGLLLQNRPDFLRHWLALNAVGAAIVPINPDLRAAEPGSVSEWTARGIVEIDYPETLAVRQRSDVLLTLQPRDFRAFGEEYTNRDGSRS